MKIRCIIVDDEPPSIDELGYIVSKIDDIEVVGSASSASKAIQAIGKFQPDLVFLDIQMPGRNGFHVAREVASYPAPPLIIFATAFDQYAIQAFEENAIDYVLKPFSEARIRKSVDRAKAVILSKTKELETPQNLENLISSLSEICQPLNRVTVENKGRLVLLDPKNVFFCKTKLKKITVYTQDKKLMCHGISSLDELEKRLKLYQFFRTHRTYLVNLARVGEIIPWFNGRYLLIMSDKSSTEIPVSRTRVKDLKEKLGFF